METKLERNIIRPKQIERPWKKARDWTKKRRKEGIVSSPAVEFIGDIRPR
jgi:hypothetical protein